MGGGSTGSIVNTSEDVFYNQLCNYILTYKLRDPTQDARQDVRKMSKNVNFIYWDPSLVFMYLQVASCRLAELVTLIKLRPFHSYFEHYIRQHKL